MILFRVTKYFKTSEPYDNNPFAFSRKIIRLYISAAERIVPCLSQDIPDSLTLLNVK